MPGHRSYVRVALPASDRLLWLTALLPVLGLGERRPSDRLLWLPSLSNSAPPPRPMLPELLLLRELLPDFSEPERLAELLPPLVDESDELVLLPRRRCCLPSWGPGWNGPIPYSVCIFRLWPRAVAGMPIASQSSSVSPPRLATKAMSSNPAVTKPAKCCSHKGVDGGATMYSDLIPPLPLTATMSMLWSHARRRKRPARGGRRSREAVASAAAGSTEGRNGSARGETCSARRPVWTGGAACLAVLSPDAAPLT